MKQQQTTAGQTAQRTLVIIRDCHSRNNIVVVANSDREEEKIRLRALSDGFLVALRKPRLLATSPAPSTDTNHAWHKPSTIEQRPRPKLGGAFQLTLTLLSKEGGAA